MNKFGYSTQMFSCFDYRQFQSKLGLLLFIANFRLKNKFHAENSIEIALSYLPQTGLVRIPFPAIKSMLCSKYIPEGARGFVSHSNPTPKMGEIVCWAPSSVIFRYFQHLVETEQKLEYCYPAPMMETVGPLPASSCHRLARVRSVGHWGMSHPQSPNLPQLQQS